MYSKRQLAKITGVSIDTLRYYESMNVIPKIGRRWNYTQEIIEKLQLVNNFKRAGFTLKEIAEFLFDNNDVSSLNEKTQKKQIEIVIERIITAQKELDKALYYIKEKELS